MAQWQELLNLDSALQKRIIQLYENRFPREIRHWLCACIESQDWDSASADENRARACFCALLDDLEGQFKRSVQENNILQGPNFSGMQDYLVKHFEDKPVNLGVLLSGCLNEEKKILALVPAMQGCGDQRIQEKWRELDKKVTGLKAQISELKKEIKTLEGLNENLDYIQKTWQTTVEQNIGLTQSQAIMKEECLKQVVFISQTKQNVLQQVVKLLNQAAQIASILTDVELPEWKRRQQLACIGSLMDTCLSNLEKWFTTITEVLFAVREQLQKLQDQNNKYSSSAACSLNASLPEFEKFTLVLITNLLTNALVVEKQPIMQRLPHRPLIVKTGVRFTVTIRFLANLPDFKCLLKVKPVFDKNVEGTMATNGFRLFDFTRDNSKVMDVDTPDGGLVAEFGHMSLKEIRAKTKGSCENYLGVTEELHIIQFETVLQHAGQKYNINASSLPVVVISASSQVSSAWASVMWWNMFTSESVTNPPTSSQQNLLLFADPPPLTWQQLSQVLSWQFLSAGQLGLDEDQLSMLKCRFVDDPEDLVHWSKFSKDESTWIWIDAILDLIRKHLADLWRDGLIMGFVSRQKTKLLLKSKETGTFLLRFSESNKDGAITFSWVDHSNEETHVHAVEPFTKQELSALSLADTINTYTLTTQGKSNYPLLYLYPDIPKDIAFGHYYKSPAPSPTKEKPREYISRTPVVISV
ncbi:signal transducer and activator of transcription 1-alpha/beta-like [Xenentodon cancila]